MNLFLKIPKNCYLYFNLNSVLLGKFMGWSVRAWKGVR